MPIRPETHGDAAVIRQMTLAAFGDHDGAADLVDRVRASDDFVPGLSLVATEGGEVVGHIMLSRVGFRGEGPDHVLSLAPLTVHPDHQGMGVGTALMEAAIAAARDAGEPIIILEGHPAYYPRFGFESAGAAGITPPHDRIPDDAWMVLFVDPAARGTTGQVIYPPAFYEAGATGV